MLLKKLKDNKARKDENEDDCGKIIGGRGQTYEKERDKQTFSDLLFFTKIIPLFNCHLIMMKTEGTIIKTYHCFLL
jgi:hypothetical protein